MKNERSWAWRVAGSLAASSLLLGGCSATIGNGPDDQGGPGDPNNPNSTGTGSYTGLGQNGECVADQPVARRLVRLTYQQLANAATAVFGADSLKSVSIVELQKREFQALLNEGAVINGQVLGKTVTLAEAATGSILDATRFATVTGCKAPTTDACAQQFLKSYAQTSYRRPLTDVETTPMLKLYTDLVAAGNSIEDATRYTVEGISLAPPSLYRSEFGDGAGADGLYALNGYETASELSYFITNTPPDQSLLDAAKAGSLASADGVSTQVNRLLALPVATANLEDAMTAYFRLNDLLTTIKDPMLFPNYQGLVASMYAETQKFIQGMLFQGTVNDLLATRKTFIDDKLAAFYGVTYPGGTGFVPFEFAQGQRKGLVTQASFLSMHSRTNTTSVVSRGLYINSNVLCGVAIPPPPSDPTTAAKIAALLGDTTLNEREKAGVRAMTSPCNGCHANFDQYGLVLESYDAIGAFRKAYPDGKPIDTSVKLPDDAGGANVKDVTEFVDTITTNNTYSRCLSSNVLKYALGSAGAITAQDCSVKAIHDNFLTSDQSFASLIRSIALSKTLAVRAEGAQ